MKIKIKGCKKFLKKNVGGICFSPHIYPSKYLQ